MAGALVDSWLHLHLTGCVAETGSCHPGMVLSQQDFNFLCPVSWTGFQERAPGAG